MLLRPSLARVGVVVEGSCPVGGQSAVDMRGDIASLKGVGTARFKAGVETHYNRKVYVWFEVRLRALILYF